MQPFGTLLRYYKALQDGLASVVVPIDKLKDSGVHWLLRTGVPGAADKEVRYRSCTDRRRNADDAGEGIRVYATIIIKKQVLRMDSIRSTCFLVPVTGVEPVRHRWRWILSPLRLPIPSHRHIEPATIIQELCPLGKKKLCAEKFLPLFRHFGLSISTIIWYTKSE